ncbi:uracil-DNA glycosylase [Fusibacter sp. JL298sf-3]
MVEKRIDCRKCLYFYVTWDPNRPMGCKAFGFKSRALPSQIVFRSSGEPCKAYQLR